MKLLHGFALFCLILLLPGCEERLKPAVSGESPTDAPPAQESWGTAVAFSDSGETRAILKAGHVSVYPERGYTILNGGVQVDFFDRSGAHSSVLTSDSGWVNDLTHDLEAIGTVKVVSDSGNTIRTERLDWDNARRLIHSESYVTIKSPTEEIQGEGFESNEVLTRYRIFHVKGTTSVK